MSSLGNVLMKSLSNLKRFDGNRNLFLIAILLTLNACSSPLSKEKVEDLGLIGARIEMLQNLSDKKDNSVLISLFDKDGKRVGNKDINLKVNDADLAFRERKELYYTTAPEYTAVDIPVAEVYNFEITLTDGKSYFLGSINPIAESNEQDIVCLEKGSLDKDFVISWNNLNEINELSINKSILLNTSTKTSKNYSSEQLANKIIGRRGKYVVPKSKYINSSSTISGLEIKFNATKSGNLSANLIKGSEIKISGNIDKNVNFEDN